MAPGTASTRDHDLRGGRRNRTRPFLCRDHDDTLEGVFERFTDRARRVLTDRAGRSALLDRSFIGTEHILLGLLREDDGSVPTRCGHSVSGFKPVRDQVQEMIGTAGPVPSGILPSRHGPRRSWNSLSARRCS